jgi:universal stress protein A
MVDRGVCRAREGRFDHDADTWVWTLPAFPSWLSHRKGASRLEMPGLDECEPAQPAGYRNVLCAVDVWSNNLPLLRWASLFACEQGSTLKLLHAIPAIKIPGARGPEDERFRISLFDMARKELRKLQQEAGTSLEAVVEGGEVAHVVHRVAEENQCDLVVIGRGVMHEMFGRMRTNVYSIIREAPCPVISV